MGTLGSFRGPGLGLAPNQQRNGPALAAEVGRGRRKPVMAMLRGAGALGVRSVSRPATSGCR